MKSKEIVLKNRNDAILDIAYNINKMCFLPKIEENFNFRSDNALRIIAHILRNDFKKGIYVTEKFIEENKYNIVEDKKYPIIFEYLKEVDEEIGKKSYRFFKKYNIDQIIEYDKAIEKIESELTEKENPKKYNLRRANIEKFFSSKKLDLLNKIFFIGILRILTGKELDLNYRYTKEEKEVLIELAKTTPDFIREEFKKANKLVKEYLNNNELLIDKGE